MGDRYVRSNIPQAFIFLERIVTLGTSPLHLLLRVSPVPARVLPRDSVGNNRVYADKAARFNALQF